MNTLTSLHFPKVRKSALFNGGTVMNGSFVAKQQVDVLHSHGDPDEDDQWRCLTAEGKEFICDGYELSPHPEAPMTNDEFVALMMNWSKSGGLMQAFILQAIEKVAVATVKAGPEVCDTPFISGTAWVETAREALGWFAARDYAEQERSGR